MFPPLLIGTMAFGGLVLLVGVVISNIAVVEMSKRLNSKHRHMRPKRWWELIGNGATSVIREYRQQAWADVLPDRRLRFGYKLIAVGLVTLLGASVLGNYLRGSL